MDPPPFFSNEDNNLNNNYNMNSLEEQKSLPPPNDSESESEHNEHQSPYIPAVDNTMDVNDMDFLTQQIQSAQNNDHLPPPFFDNDNEDDNRDTKTPPSVQHLEASTTNDTPEPPAAHTFLPPPSSSTALIRPNIKSTVSLPPVPPPPVPHSYDSKEPPLARNRIHSYNVPPPSRTDKSMQTRARRDRKTSPPAPPKPGHAAMKSEPTISLGAPATGGHQKQDIDQVSFTSVLRQVDVGIEMTDRLKEVIRKFCKHQQMGADKLQEIYTKLPSCYEESDGMADFAELCALVHTLILETVSAQKRLADFLFKDVVPKMDQYIKDKQQQIQQLKRDNHQAEMKLKNSINAMNKASNTARSTASKAKQMAQDSHSKRRKHSAYQQEKKKKNFGGLFNKFGGGGGANANLSEEEIVYLKAQKNQLTYEAAVMGANYEQKTYADIRARFKRDCRGYEEQRLNYCRDKVQQFTTAHRSYFNNETIAVLQTRIMSSLDSLDEKREFAHFLQRIIAENAAKGQNHREYTDFVPTKFDYQNVFHSLQDSMDITHKLAPHSKLPLMLTCLCNKVRQLNGFETEGIFRKSAMATEIDRLKDKLSRNIYEIDTVDPHVAACLLKDWLRGLKDSLIPQSHYDMAIQMAKKNEVKEEALEVFLSQLPEVNRITIKYLVMFLKDLIQEENVPKTRMNIENVAIVFAPTILKCPHGDAKLLLANSRHEKTFTIDLLNELCTDNKQ